jgi:hypothetical protein
MSGFIFFSPAAYTGAYRLLCIAIFPQVEISIELPAPDALSGFPASVQEIMKEGQKRVNSLVAFIILGFTLLGAIIYLLGIFISGIGMTALFFVPAALGYLVGLPLGILRTYKWQRRARQSGIPEEQLKAAAKAAHLWWPKARETAKLQKPGKYTGS